MRSLSRTACVDRGWLKLYRACYWKLRIKGKAVLGGRFRGQIEFLYLNAGKAQPCSEIHMR